VQGQLLARNGAVTLDSNTITNAICTTVRVTPRLTLKLSGLTKGVVKVGREVTAKGKLTPIVLAGSRVKITVQKLVNGRWVTVKTAMRRTTSTGTYSWRYLPPKSGTYRTRTTIAGTPTSTSATTTWRRFTVVSAPIPPFTG
jgi:type VI secretion system secreted protein VgrG